MRKVYVVSLLDTDESIFTDVEGVYTDKNSALDVCNSYEPDDLGFVELIKMNEFEINDDINKVYCCIALTEPDGFESDIKLFESISDAEQLVQEFKTSVLELCNDDHIDYEIMIDEHNEFELCDESDYTYNIRIVEFNLS